MVGHDPTIKVDRSEIRMARRQRMEGKMKQNECKPPKNAPFTGPFLKAQTTHPTSPSKTLPPPFKGAIRIELSCFILFVRAFIQVKLLDFNFPALLATLGPRGIKGYPEP